MYPNNAQPIAVVDQEAVSRARYFAHVQRRAMPPRCSPFSILIIILSLGMIFIGLTMTIIANWPGATSIGENPLKIAGPVLLAVGSAVFLLGMVLTCWLNSRERRKWEENLTNLAVERTNAVMSQPLVSQYPGGPFTEPVSGSESYKPTNKSILRGSKTSGEESEVPGYYSGGSNKGYPSPNDGKANGGPEAQIPDPVRLQKARPTPRGNGSSGGSANVSSEIGAADLGGIGVYSPPAYRISSDEQKRMSPSAYANPGYVYSETQGRDPRDADSEEKEGRRRRQQGRGGGTGGAGDSGVGHGQPTRPTSKGGIGGSGLGAMDQQHLRLHIKAQPGTAIHITPSATPPRGTPLGTPPRGGQRLPSSSARVTLSHGESSAETEI